MSEYKRVTLQSVAKEANVSYASVSAVLNGKDGQSIRVGKETKAKILECATRLGYVPNMAARKLKNGRNSLIAVFTYEQIFPVDAKNEFYRFFLGIQETAEKNGYDLLILNNRPTVGNPSSRIALADGAVMIGVNRDDQDIVRLVQNNYPLVFVGRREVAGASTHWVTFDYKEVISQMVVHLLPFCSTGKLVYVEERAVEREPRRDKRRYLLDVAQKQGLEVEIIEADENNRITVTEMATIAKAKVAIFDRLSLLHPFEVLCQEQGLVLGRDLATAVLEDDWSGTYANWTRWTNERFELGALAVEYLSAMLDGKDRDSLPRFTPLTLIVSETSGNVLGK
ncbi:LacI family DNA-binding transcriptional regulator [uncultured Sphaerochaeta sp.]|uniref:LacI family DNA-binding transcriptional regulator n=1 Tax=uncultured Sphaerochaeta sp. TaxID=886478 RepID=UPI002A0A9E06|nr:LacI family DNA-binding transcriptional regulator [uncultured Sphaerochaeta sp.]